jgi:hypothetical protein
VLALLGCAQDPMSGYDVELRTSQDCTQVGISAPQCVDAAAALARVRAGRWIVEDKGGANILNPFSSFMLTTDRGRTVSGVHFPNDAALATTPSCAGEGGVCYFARVRVDTIDDETGCQSIEERSFDFRVVDEVLTGTAMETRLIGFEEQCSVDEDEVETCELVPLAACGTTTVAQIIVEATGLLVDDPVRARDREELLP